MRPARCLPGLLVLATSLAALAPAAPANAGLPAKPAQYVEDAAGLLRPATRAALVEKLDAFERDTSDQVLVAIFPTVPADYALEDFTQRTAEAWGVGQKKTDNGAVLFIFSQDHKLRIEVGYGLEGAIPDATARAILEREITPAFRAGDFDGGVTRGVDALLQAARGEYQGNGRTNADRATSDGDGLLGPSLLFLLLLGAFMWSANRAGGRTYDRRGARRSGGIWPGPFFGGGGGFGGGSGGGFGGGGSSGGGGGGGFSGGGGGFGGGGASGGW